MTAQTGAMRLVALVPLRAGSKGLPGKNTRLLAGKPLYCHAVDQALAAGADEVVLSTDIAELLAADHGARVRAVRRPAELAGDAVPMDPVIAHVLRAHLAGPARVVLLQATSPLRLPEDILAAIDQHAAGGHDLVMSVCPADSGVLKWGFVEGGRFRALVRPEHPFMNRQALPPVWRPNGAVYVFDADWFRASGTLATASVGAVEMPPERSADIDTQADFEQVARLLAARGREKG
ncbi:cytidylyltransferase domain-containing protein [Alkalilacustris brevis]|uniref:acylneuraminate cytidylyltransferase family protein n=1 Tax=Alkalilacustris brevis TaxID=2026338 RepID=UPI00192E6DFD|nr:acylneuraminate cytidylyltransferase family protein [Alkalilacustris brevis]